MPVLALRRGSAPEVVQDGITGLVADDPAELVAGARIADKFFDRARIRALARQRWSADFIILYSEYIQWTGDRATADQLLPAAEAALRWIEEHGDKDGDGFVEYQRKTERGLENQGWKDSRDGVPNLDGMAARPPIALVEVQGYCFDARRRMARIYRRLGRREDAARCTQKAVQLARRIDEAFWDERTGTYAIALDGEKRQVRSIASNMGHLLWSRAIPEAKARRVARALLSAEGFNGWASGAVFLMLRAILGIYPDGPHRSLRIVNPQLPAWMNELTLRGLRVGGSRISLHFTRTGEGCFAAVTETEGDHLALRIEVGAGTD